MKLNLAALALFALGSANSTDNNAPTNNLRGQSQRQLQSNGFHESLGRCNGAVCGMWGDPHMVTCDGLAYDCQGIGIFTLMENHMFNIQANFVDVGAREHVKVRGWGLTHGASITNDVMIQYKEAPDIPIMQFGFGDVEGYLETVPSETGCDPWMMLEPLGNRYQEDDLASCRALCEATPGCTQFTYFADKGCYPNTADAVPVRSNKEWARALHGTMDGECGTSEVHALPVVGSSGEEEKHGEMRNSCPLLMYLDGELVDLSQITPGPNNGRVFLWGEQGDDHYVTLENNDQVHIVHKLPDSEEYTEIELRRTGYGPGELWSCHWNFYVCLPAAQQELFEVNTIGLLGTPNGNVNDDWMTRDGEGLPLQHTGSQRHKNTYEYCVDNWCVSEEDSLMTYHGDTDYGDYKCQEEEHFDWKKDNEKCILAADQIQFACKDMPPLLKHACEVDCCLGGCGLIEETTDEVKDIVVNDADKDDVVVIFDGDEDTCDDLVINNTPSTVCPGSESIVKLLRTKGDEPLPEGADVFYDLTFGEGSVSFKINNPFEAAATAYVRHEKDSGIGLFSDATCDASQLTPSPCADDFRVDVKCKDFGDDLDFALVNVYFASVAVSPLNEQAVIDRCCNAGDFAPAVGIVQYTFEVRCGCPGGEPAEEVPIATKPPKTKAPKETNDSQTAPPTTAPGDAREAPPTDAPRTKPPREEVNEAAPENAPFDCDEIENLGLGFSEATGNPHYSRTCYPHITGLNANDLPGRDDSVAVFVGGDYTGVSGAEVEGNMVVLGNLVVKGGGPGNFVSVGAGTHVLPNSGGDCVIVGGNLEANREIQVFNQVPSMQCNIVYRGNEVSKYHWKTNGSVQRDETYDLSRYEKMRYVLKQKSQYWKTLASTADVFSAGGGETKFRCEGNEDINVFNIYPSDYGLLSNPSSYKFTGSCSGKTVLINVHGSGNVNVNAAAMFHKGKSGYGANGFSTCLTQSILWNFPDAANVNIGNGWSSEFHGSVLVGGNLRFTTTGHSGRTIVLGDLTQNKGGSEFHNYPYAPPTDLPDRENVCEVPADYERAVIPELVAAAAMEAPTNGRCNAKKGNNGGATDEHCKQCEGPNPVTWWPCSSRNLCEGAGCIFSV